MTRCLWPPFTSLLEQLDIWAARYPDRLTVEYVGESLEHRPIPLVVLTDRSVPDTDKERVLFTGLHSGIERTGTTTLFSLMEWLLHGEESAPEILRKQVLWIMPVVNPDGYCAGTHANTAGYDPYTTWTLEGPAHPEETPEAVAVQQVMDRFQPDIHADIHGLDLSFPSYMSLENSGNSYSNSALRPYHQEFLSEMDTAALEAGFPTEQGEQSAERLPWGPDIDGMSDKLWLGRPRPYAALYCYRKYHTMPFAAEVMWEASGLARCRRLLELGNDRWPVEYYPGYPVRTAASSILYSITAYGTNAEERRRSRVELWNRLDSLAHGMMSPQTEGKVAYACATTAESIQKLRNNATIDDLVRIMSEIPSADANYVASFLTGYPEGSGQWGNHPELYITGASGEKAETEPVQHGLSLRMKIPYGSAELTDVRINGCPVALSETNGYITWQSRGFTVVQANIPPEALCNKHLFLVTVAYDPCETRTRGWTPPDVRDRHSD